MTVFYHVTSVKNRESILAHGLDWTRMGAAPGIAGSRTAEQEGIFLVADEFEADWFVWLNNTGGPVDVWEVRGVEESSLVESPHGYRYLPGAIPRDRVRLLRRDLPPRPDHG